MIVSERLVAERCTGGWPLRYLYDELWLKTRRVAIAELEAAGLWLRVDDRRSILLNQRAIGDELSKSVLHPFIGAGDYAWIHSECIFGLSDFRLRLQLPHVLAFGQFIGIATRALLTGRVESDSDAARLSALFNLGISLLDNLCDSVPGGKDSLARALSPETLSLSAQPLPANPAIASAEFLELHIVTRYVARFFGRLQELPNPSSLDAAGELLKLMSRALRAQMLAAGDAQASSPQIRLESVKQKSTLPFEIIYVLVCAASDKAVPDNSHQAARFAQEMGSMFRLADDLADLMSDARSGAPNSLLLPLSQAKEPESSRRSLEEVLESEVLVQASRELVNSARSAVNRLQTLDQDYPGWRLEDVLLAHLGGWIES